MLTLSQILLYFLLFIAYITIIYAVGRLFIPSRSENRWFDIFNAVAIGLFFVVISSAVIYSRFQTVYLGCAILLFTLKGQRLPSLRDLITRLKYVSIKELVPIWLIGSLFFILNLIFYRTVGDTKIPHEDYLFYSQIANNLFNGYEGLNYKLYEFGIIQSKQLSPYHYFELWTSVPVISISGNPVWSLNLISYPLLQAVALIGLYSITNHFFHGRIKTLVTCLLLFFIGGLQFGFMHTFIARNFTGFVTDTALFTQFGRKYGIIYIAVYYAVIHLLNGNKSRFMIGIALAAFFYPTIAPGVVAFMLLHTFLNHRFLIAEYKKLLVPVSLALFPLFFYLFSGMIAGSQNTIFDVEETSPLIAFRYNIGAWFVIITALSMGVYLLPVTVFFRNLSENLKPYALLVPVMLITGFIISITIVTKKDQIQFYSNTLPFLLILIQIAIMVWIGRRKVIPYIFLVATAGYAFFWNFNKQNRFNFTVDSLNSKEDLANMDRLMERYDRNCYYGFVWDSTKIEKLNIDTQLWLSSNYGYLKINGYINAVNLTPLPDAKKGIPYDEPFQAFAYGRKYEDAIKEWNQKHDISFILQ